MRFNYQHHIVRDLAWAIASPPLLRFEQASCRWYDSGWYQDLYITSQEWLQRLDQAPQALQARLDSQKDRRLGRYVETLWAFWLENSARFEVMEQNLPFRDGGKTLGELDFLVLDKASGESLHWEMAVKFYLGVGDTRQHSNWHGPGKKDRLDLKVEHLSHRQSVICQRPVVQKLLQERGHQIDACGVILKGRLFYPYASGEEGFMPLNADPRHLRSYWLTVSDLQKTKAVANSFSPLLGYGWLAGPRQHHKMPWLSMKKLLEAIKNGDFHLPLHLACKSQEAVNQRFFIVANDWMVDLSQV